MAELDLSNLPDATIIAHYRADQGTTIDTGVSQWDDLSGNDYHLTQATGGSQPELVADGGADFNNQAVIRFAGTDNFLARATTPALSQPYTWVTIVKSTSDDSPVLICNEAASSPFLRFTSSPEMIMFAGGTVAGNVDGGTVDATVLSEAYFAGASSVLRGNFATIATGNPGTGSFAGIEIGRRSSSVGYLTGDVAEVIIFSGALTHADRVYLAQYVNQRYGFDFPFPQTANPTVTSIGSASTTHNANIPAAKKGELLLAFNSYFGSSLISTPSGWTPIYIEDGATAPGAYEVRLFAAVLAEDFAGGTQNFQTLTSATFCSQVYKVSLWSGSVADIAAAVTTGTGTTADPPNLAPPWGALNALWFAVAHAFDDDQALSGTPSGFTTVISTISGGGTNDGCSIGTCRQQVAASSINPGAITIASTEEWIAATAAVAPISAVPLIAGGSGIMAGGV
jgi:hypothetical protein